MPKAHNELSVNEYTLNNINNFITSQELKKTRLAKKLNMSPQNLYDYLGNRRKGILDFAKQLADVLGYKEMYFIDPDFKLPYDENRVRAMAFSASEQLSTEAQEGFKNLLKICDLFEIYSLED